MFIPNDAGFYFFLETFLHVQVLLRDEILGQGLLDSERLGVRVVEVGYPETAGGLGDISHKHNNREIFVTNSKKLNYHS